VRNEDLVVFVSILPSYVEPPKKTAMEH